MKLILAVKKRRILCNGFGVPMGIGEHSASYWSYELAMGAVRNMFSRDNSIGSLKSWQPAK